MSDSRIHVLLLSVCRSLPWSWVTSVLSYELMISSMTGVSRAYRACILCACQRAFCRPLRHACMYILPVPLYGCDNFPLKLENVYIFYNELNIFPFMCKLNNLVQSYKLFFWTEMRVCPFIRNKGTFKTTCTPQNQYQLNIFFCPEKLLAFVSRPNK